MSVLPVAVYVPEEGCEEGGEGVWHHPLPAAAREVVHLDQSLSLHSRLQGEGLEWSPGH